jgi:hypothetical protein
LSYLSSKTIFYFEGASALYLHGQIDFGDVAIHQTRREGTTDGDGITFQLIGEGNTFRFLPLFHLHEYGDSAHQTTGTHFQQPFRSPLIDDLTFTIAGKQTGPAGNVLYVAP